MAVGIETYSPPSNSLPWREGELVPSPLMGACPEALEGRARVRVNLCLPARDITRLIS